MKPDLEPFDLFHRLMNDSPVKVEAHAPFPAWAGAQAHTVVLETALLGDRLLRPGQTLCRVPGDLLNAAHADSLDACLTCTFNLPNLQDVDPGLVNTAGLVVDHIHSGSVASARQTLASAGLDPRHDGSLRALLGACAREALVRKAVYASPVERIVYGPAAHMTGDPFSEGHAWRCMECDHGSSHISLSHSSYRWLRGARRAAQRHAATHTQPVQDYVGRARLFELTRPGE